MDNFAFNPAFPFPVPTTTSFDLQQQQQQPMSGLSLPPDPQVVKEANAASNENTAAPGGHSSLRKRGRPRKLKPTTDPNFQHTVVEPPVNEVNGSLVTEEVVPEKRVTRPAKRFGADMVHKDVVRKNKKIIQKAVLRGPLGYPKRGPGRPPKSRSVTDVSHGPVKTLAVAGMKRRGRPKRLLPHKLETVATKAIGLGSEKKAGSRVLGPVDPRWMVDYAHVRAKIDHIQSRMREAIGVIKPQLMNQILTNGHIGTALQELDQISTMDVMAVSLSFPVEEPQAAAETQVY